VPVRPSPKGSVETKKKVTRWGVENKVIVFLRSIPLCVCISIEFFVLYILGPNMYFCCVYFGSKYVFLLCIFWVQIRIFVVYILGPNTYFCVYILGPNTYFCCVYFGPKRVFLTLTSASFGVKYVSIVFFKLHIRVTYQHSMFQMLVFVDDASLTSCDNSVAVHPVMSMHFN
jgi:hypothetical protein